MALFSLLWAPLVYGLWRSLYPAPPAATNAALIWPLLTGLALAALRLLPLPEIQAGGFGISRYISAFFEYTSFVPLAALLACALLPSVVSGDAFFDDWTGFLLAAYIPAGAAYTIDGSLRQHPLYLVLPPLMWTNCAFAANSLRGFARGGGGGARKAAAFVLAALYLACAAACWWAFYCQKNAAGWGLLAASFVPPAHGLALLKRARAARARGVF
jgi:hypothetical protein